MHRIHFMRRITAALLLSLPIVACDEQQSAEKTGQEIGRALDQAAGQVGEAAGEVAAGAGRLMRDAGQAIERTVRDTARETEEPAEPGSQ